MMGHDFITGTNFEIVQYMPGFLYSLEIICCWMSSLQIFLEKREHLYTVVGIHSNSTIM
jgi:hypothetical protein